MVGLAAISVLGKSASGTFSSVGMSIGGGGGGGGSWTRSAPTMPRAAESDALAGMDRSARFPIETRPAEPAPAVAPTRLPQSGILTAGSLDDSIDPHSFACSCAARPEPHCGGLQEEFSGRRLTIVVKDADARPVGNARVLVTSATDGGNATGVTRSDGRAIILAGWDRLPESAEWKVTITPPGKGRPIVETIPATATRWEITLADTKAALPTRLDLGIVLDTTGSMGDELRFLQSEIKSITATVKADFPNVDQRFGLVLFRDQGRCLRDARSGSRHPSRIFIGGGGQARRGGDEPEAIHLGLEEARKLGWRDGNTARVLFLLTDAPPHSQHMRRTLEAADALRKQGVVIYPIACSGYTDPAEFTLRACALMTGSSFLFLTNDSGVGAAHADPHASSFQVQKLERLMVRMIAGELSGRRIDADKPDVLRTVGKPIN